MTVILDQQWQSACLDTYRLNHHHRAQQKKPSLRVSPVHEFPQSPRQITPSKPLSLAPDSGLLSPAAAASPTSPRSPSKFKKMHLRVRSISSSKTPLSARQVWDRLSDADRAKSDRFAKDAIATCGLAGYSWKKTYEYLNLAKELPLPPDFVVDADDVPPTTPSSSRLRLGSFLEKKPSANSLLTPDSASGRTSASRPDTPESSLASVSTQEPDLKPILTNIRLAFEQMQQSRDPVYMHYINLPDNNLKKMHGVAVAAHRAATLKKERSSIMDAIEFDRKAEKAFSMEMAVAKLRFEMELDLPEAAPASSNAEAKSTGSVSSRPTQTSSKSGVSSSVPPGQRRPLDLSDMRAEASQNNRISGVPTIITTVSDFNHLRHLSMASSIDRPDSAASARSDNHVQSRETWRRLQEAKARLSRRSKSRVDGIAQPGLAQKIDENGYFSSRPSESS